MPTADTSRTIVIRDSIEIAAPIERMFALSTSVPLVQRTLGFKPVEGVTDGHVIMDSRVLWKGWLFGLPQHHLTLITGYEPPRTKPDGTASAFFQDTQERGRFKAFHHNHHMAATPGGGTVLSDDIHYSLPFGILGYLVARFVMQPYIRHTLRSRFRLLQHTATTDGEWQRYM